MVLTFEQPVKITPALKTYKSKHGYQLIFVVRYKELRFDLVVADDSGYPTHLYNRNDMKLGLVIAGKNARLINALIEKRKQEVIKIVGLLQENDLRIDQYSIFQSLYKNVSIEQLKQRNTNVDTTKFRASNAISVDSRITNLLIIFEKYYKRDSPKSYHTLLKVLKEYKEFNKFKKLETNEFGYDLINHFMRYMTTKSEIDYTIGTVKKHLKHIKHFGKWLRKYGYIYDRSFEDFELSVGEKQSAHVKYRTSQFSNVPSETLKPDEFKKLVNTDYEDEVLNKVRDMFYLQTMLGGIRSIDFYNLTFDDFIEEEDSSFRIKFHSTKTGFRVNNKLTKRGVKILKDWQFDIQHIKVAEYNKLLKIIAEKANLNRDILIYKEIASAKKPKIERKKLYENISTKTARKTAVSCLISLGYSQDDTGKFTGHSSNAIQNYIIIFDEQLDIMQNHLEETIDDI